MIETTKSYMKTTYESRKLKLYTELTLVYTRQTALFTQFEIDVAEHNKPLQSVHSKSTKLNFLSQKL